MRRPTRLFVLGVLLLTAAFAVPFVDFMTADWDRDYRYRTPNSGFCADAVADVQAGGSPQADDFVVTRGNLSDAALRDVERAERQGSYTVENESDADGPFIFATDHQARGLGCYAIYDSETDTYQALATEAVNHRTDRLQQRLVPWVGRTLAATGVLSLLASVALTVRRRLRRE